MGVSLAISHILQPPSLHSHFQICMAPQKDSSIGHVGGGKEHMKAGGGGRGAYAKLGKQEGGEVEYELEMKRSY